MPMTELHFVESWRKRIGPADNDVGGSTPDRDRVDVLIAPVHRLATEESFRKLLGTDDEATLSQITTAAGRDVSCAARILLRIGLSHATGWLIEPCAWRMRLSLTGKPTVAEGLPKVNFSISHSDQVVVAAF